MSKDKQVATNGTKGTKPEAMSSSNGGLSKLSKERKSLLLYLEFRAVDHHGAVNTIHMNSADMTIANEWNEMGFVQFGRIARSGVMPVDCSHWCCLSKAAFRVAAALRMERAERGFKARAWSTIAERRADLAMDMEG